MPSATESLIITNNTSDNHIAGYINSELRLTAEKKLFNGDISALTAKEVIWEFSTDGGQTFTQSSTDGIISSGIFIPKTTGLYSIRAKTLEKIAFQGIKNIIYKDHQIISENILTINVTDVPYWHILVNGKSGNWHFPLAQKFDNSESKKISFGNNNTGNTTNTTDETGEVTENSNTVNNNSNTSEIINLATQNNSNELNVENLNNEETNTSTTSTEDIDFTKYRKVALYNELELNINNKNNDEIEWYSTISTSGYLQNNAESSNANDLNHKCTEEKPCTGDSVIFLAGDTTGTSTITLQNKSLNETISYTVTVLKPHKTDFVITTEKSYEQINKNQFFIQEEIKFTNDSDAQNLVWEFSYDGGTTWERSSDDGIISAGKFIPKKSGLVSIRTTLYEAIAEAGVEKLTFTKYEIQSQVEAMRIDEAQIKIDSAYTLGRNVINRNTDTSIIASISSREAIKKLQSLSVGLFSGNITANNYTDSTSQSFIFKEYHNETPVKDYLENSTGEQNRGIVEIPVFIPEYDKQRYMPDGKYTFIVELYRNDRVISRYFIPVVLGNNFTSCDINDDGFQNVIDLILSLKFLNGSLHPSENELERVDKNHNGLIDLQDILILFPCIIGNSN